jgi:hypothetical protein
MFRPPPSGSASFSSDASSIPDGRGLTSALSPSTLSFVSMSVDPPPPPAARSQQFGYSESLRQPAPSGSVLSSPMDSPVAAERSAKAIDAGATAPASEDTTSAAARVRRPSPLQTLLVKMTPVSAKSGSMRAGDALGEDSYKALEGAAGTTDASAAEAAVRREGPLPPRVIIVDHAPKASAAASSAQQQAHATDVTAAPPVRYQALVDQAVKRSGASSSKPVQSLKTDGVRDADVALTDRLKSLDSAIASLHTAGFGGSYASRHARSRR